MSGFYLIKVKTFIGVVKFVKIRRRFKKNMMTTPKVSIDTIFLQTLYKRLRDSSCS